ncbi:hypothetical protein [Vreelandella alkaliphila]|uniref:Major capsid protein n=1 Tax=Vreelandella alkaliphila TaxID=272774 RepID=A0AAJ2S4B3_9GAMM|nr:hypothetical protein [Halomonas alkaliphila]MDX5979644.1 hypothetical protein [Halomonas alkaliphila]
MSSQSNYMQRLSDINSGARAMTNAVITPQMDGEQFIGEAAERNSQLEQAVSGSIFEAFGESAPMILATQANAVRAFKKKTGRMPSAEVLASSHKALENLAILAGGKGPEGIMESVGPMSTSEGQILRDHMAALVLPIQLNTITNDMVTSVPANFDRTEIFRVERIAGNTFGDLKKGDVIDQFFRGQYSSMDQRKALGVGDGSKTSFTHAVGMPIRKSGANMSGYVVVYLDRNQVAVDDGRGNIFGNGVTGSVNYETGEIAVNFATAPASGLEIHVGYDVSIEKDPSLIPSVDHDIQSWVIVPHESAISGQTTVQALFQARREFGLDMSSMTVTAMRNILSADKDRKRLNDMWFFANGTTTWDMTVPSALAYHEHYESLREVLMNISTELMMSTKISGLRGLVAGRGAANVFKSLRAPYFEVSPGYKEIPQPHYVGRLFGMYDLYCDPAAEQWETLCFAKGDNHGDSGYVAADAITAVPFKHPVGADLRHRDTLYELAYRTMHPYNGRAWFRKLKFTTS